MSDRRTPFGPRATLTDDPAIVDNPYQVDLFLGAPQFRSTGPTYFPASAPGRPSVVFGAPASSSSAACLFPPGGDWQETIGHLAEGSGPRAGGDYQDGGDGSPRARPGGAPGRDYPVTPQAAHREEPREGARYAYRGTIVGEASHPGPADPDAVPRGRRSTVGRRWGLVDLGEGRACLSGGGGSPTPVVDRRPPMVTKALPLLAGADCAPRVGGLPPRPTRWASPGVNTGVSPLASIGRGRAKVPATATGVSSLVKPPILGLSHPPLTSRVLRRRGKF